MYSRSLLNSSIKEEQNLESLYRAIKQNREKRYKIRNCPTGFETQELISLDTTEITLLRDNIENYLKNKSPICKNKSFFDLIKRINNELKRRALILELSNLIFNMTGCSDESIIKIIENDCSKDSLEKIREKGDDNSIFPKGEDFEIPSFLQDKPIENIHCRICQNKRNTQHHHSKCYANLHREKNVNLTLNAWNHPKEEGKKLLNKKRISEHSEKVDFNLLEILLSQIYQDQQVHVNNSN